MLVSSVSFSMAVKPRPLFSGSSASHNIAKQKTLSWLRILHLLLNVKANLLGTCFLVALSGNYARCRISLAYMAFVIVVSWLKNLTHVLLEREVKACDQDGAEAVCINGACEASSACFP
jgi:hypothetical protein